MSAEESSDKTEPASDSKLEEAKKKGNIWKSTELISIVMIVGALIILGNTVRDLEHVSEIIYQKSFTDSGRFLNNVDIMNLSYELISEVFYAIMPALLFVVMIAVAVNLVQTGFILFV